MAFQEFYVNAGDNLNSGSTDSPTASHTYAGGTFVRATGVFTVASGDPAADGVAVGDWASIYTTAGATNATFVARVTARDSTTITVSLTAIAGSVTTVSETGAAATCKVGGSWAGPSGADDFPFDFALGTLRNAAGNQPRVNFKAGTYNMTASMQVTLLGPIQWQGYQNTPGDGIDKGLQDTSSKAIFDGGTSGAITYYNLLKIESNAENNTFADMIFANNGGTGVATNGDGVLVNDAECMFVRCVFHDFRRAGLRFTSVGHAVECEAYACNKSNTTGFGGFNMDASGSTAIRCIAHDNSGSNVDGFVLGACNLIECISDSNGRDGARSLVSDTNLHIQQCDFYNNAGNGLRIGSGSGSMMATVENSNFVNNGGNGINFQNAITMGVVHNCGFGSGTMANDGGDISAVDGMEISGNVTYGADLTPWVDPANGDFRINLAAAKGTGRGQFLQTASGYTGTVAYPDIGSNQTLASGDDGSKKRVLAFFSAMVR